ncbi:MAG: glycosyltransferase family 2 protein [Rhodobacteraceae bacterium]|nr:glycosyltransferase family 2 protein [Paracoccaceae bacterium]
MDTPALRVAICIATYRRPEGLLALLTSLSALQFGDAPPQVEIIIVDNAPEAPAVETLGPLGGLSRWPITYVIETVRGIVAARNRALDEIAAQVDYIAFLDDDEIVEPIWLAALLATIQRTGAAAVQGQLEPIYETSPTSWMDDLGIFRLGPYQEGEVKPSAAVGNVLIDAAFIREHALRFDMRFNLTGGEDEEFFKRLRRVGGLIVTSPRALVRETVPAARMTASWIAQRYFRKGNTLGRIALLHANGRAIRLSKGLAGIGIGAVVALVSWPFSASRAIKGLLEVCRGAGTLAAFVNFEFLEYRASAVDRDRRREL